MNGRIGICSLLAATAWSCSKPESAPAFTSEKPAGSIAAGARAATAVATTAAAGSSGRGVWETGATTLDAGVHAVSSAEARPLQARVQVNGASTPCGSCAVVLAQVQGGTLPYSYVWSDPALQGPGPHQVCPVSPTEYSVVVTDASGTDSTPEFKSEAQTAKATGKVDCQPAVADAGTVDFMGCMTVATTTVNGQAATCEMGENGIYSGSGMLPMPLLAGHTYTLAYDQVIPIVIGEPVQVDIYGANTPCDPEEKLTSWTLDGTWHHPGCFTPTRDFNYVLVQVYVGFTLFYLEFASGSTFCAGCNEVPRGE